MTDKISNEAAWKMYRDEGGGLKNRSVRFDIRRSEMLRYMDSEIRDAKVVFGRLIMDIQQAKLIKSINQRVVLNTRNIFLILQKILS